LATKVSGKTATKAIPWTASGERAITPTIVPSMIEVIPISKIRPKPASASSGVELIPQPTTRPLATMIAIASRVAVNSAVRWPIR
jgi:hypothetical protein